MSMPVQALAYMPTVARKLTSGALFEPPTALRLRLVTVPAAEDYWAVVLRIVIRVDVILGIRACKAGDIAFTITQRAIHLGCRAIFE